MHLFDNIVVVVYVDAECWGCPNEWIRCTSNWLRRTVEYYVLITGMVEIRLESFYFTNLHLMNAPYL